MLCKSFPAFSVLPIIQKYKTVFLAVKFASYYEAVSVIPAPSKGDDLLNLQRRHLIYLIQPVGIELFFGKPIVWEHNEVTLNHA